MDIDVNMFFDTHDYFTELVSAGVPEGQAEVHTRTIKKIVENDLAKKKDIEELRSATKKDIQLVRKDIEELRALTSRDIEELRTSTSKDIEELRTSTSRDIEGLKVSTKRDMKEIEMKMQIYNGSLAIVIITVLTLLQKLV